MWFSPSLKLPATQFQYDKSLQAVVEPDAGWRYSGFSSPSASDCSREILQQFCEPIEKKIWNISN